MSLAQSQRDRNLGNYQVINQDDQALHQGYNNNHPLMRSLSYQNQYGMDLQNLQYPQMLSEKMQEKKELFQMLNEAIITGVKLIKEKNSKRLDKDSLDFLEQMIQKNKDLQDYLQSEIKNDKWYKCSKCNIL